MEEKVRRRTVQRSIIYKALIRDKSHPSAQELHRKVKRRVPHISFGTVYRTLNLLKEQGLIQELPMGDDASRWDGNSSSHYHFVCRGCQKITDLSLPVRKDLDRKLEGLTGLKVFNHRLEFYGLCASCQDIQREGR